MRYAITRLAAGQHEIIPISQEEFIRIKKAKACYLVVLGIEEKLDIFLENYAEFERELLSLTLRRSVFQDFDWHGLMDDIQATNRRLANLLMSLRLYTDQIKRNVATLFGRHGQKRRDILDALDKQRQSSFGLRVLDELRNHIQHRDLPIRHLTHHIGRSGDTASPRIRYRIKPSLQVAALREDQQFDREILRALEEKGETVPVTQFVREGVEATCRFHEHLRDLIAIDIEAWCYILQDVLTRGRAILGEDLTALGVVAEDEEERCLESEHIFDDLLQRRLILVKKNCSLSDLSLRFVSGESVETSA